MRHLFLMLSLWMLGTPLGAQDLIQAVKQGDLIRVQALVKQDGSIINIADTRQCTPLHYACDRGNLEMVRFFAEKGADLNVQDVDGDCPAAWALARNHKHVVRYLVNQGADVRLKNNNQYTLLHWAALNSDGEMVRFFIEKGVPLDAQDFEHRTALLHAAERANVSAVMALIEGGADPELADDYGRTPLVLAARQNGNVEIMTRLLDQGVNIDSTDKFGDGALTLAAWRGYEETVDLLLDRGVSIPTDVNHQWNLLLYSASKAMEKLFGVMMAKGLDLDRYNEEGGKLIHNAAQGGSPEIMKALLEHGFDIDGRDFLGWAPLHYAAEEGHEKVVRLLIDHQCDLDIQTLAGASALNIAEAAGHQAVADLLRARGANSSPVQFPKLCGELMGQQKHKDGPELFARGIVATKDFSHSPIAFSPNGDEAFWPSSAVDKQTGFSSSFLLFSRQINGVWSRPEKAPFNTEYGEEEPYYSADGNRLYFISERPLGEGAQPGAEHFWVVDRTPTGWGEPRALPAVINRFRKHWQFSVDQESNLYFGAEDPSSYGLNDIYVSRWKDGAYTEPENLGPAINTASGEFCPVIARDGSYLLFTSDQAGISLYVSFRFGNQWSAPIRLSDHLPGLEYSLGAQISPDGEYLFFLGQEYGIDGICWVRIAETIEKLRRASRFQVDFDGSSVEKVILEPEAILKDISGFWQSDRAYGMVKKWHDYERLEVDLVRWEEKLKEYASVPKADRENSPYLKMVRAICNEESSFIEQAVPFLLSFLPKSTPPIRTTAFFVEETRTGGFIQDDHVVVDVTRQSDRGVTPLLNTLIHELFHVGYAYNRLRRTEYQLDNIRLLRMVDLLQNEGMATYAGFLADESYPALGIKKSYKKLRDIKAVRQLIQALNHLFTSALSIEDKAFYKLQGEIGYDQNAYYIVGAHMAKTIDDKLGRLALVETVSMGPRSFIATYNKLVPLKERVVEFPIPSKLPAAHFLKQAYIHNNREEVVRLSQEIRDQGERLEKANEAILNMTGYYLIKEHRLSEAVEVLALAAECFPSSANAFDSLGEAYRLVGNHEEAEACRLKYEALRGNIL